MSSLLKNRSNTARAVLTVFALLATLTPALRADTPAVAAGKTQRLFWKITSPTTEVYFLGSVHLATPDFYPLPPEIEAAFKKSDVLMVEADVTKVNEAEMMTKVMQTGMYTQGDSLEKHISPETMKALKAFCDKNQLPVAVMGMFKPVMAAMTVESMMIDKMGMSPDQGIDMHFLKAAAESKKKVQEFETADSQLDLLMTLDDKLADKWLADSLKESSSDELDKVIKGWKAGDSATIEKLTLEDDKNDPDAQKLNDLLIYKRNDNMVKKIQDLLKGNERGFVVVGSAHLLGDRGIMKQLEKAGYKVEKPELTAPPSPLPSRHHARRPQELNVCGAGTLPGAFL